MLEALGIEYESRYTYLVAKCPIHKGYDKNWCWWFNNEKWKCFSHNCETKVIRPDAIGIIEGVLELDRKKATEYAIKTLNIKDDIDCSDAKVLSDIELRHIDREIKKKKPRPKKVYKIDKLVPHDYLIDRGFDRELLSLYQIGYCDNKNSEMFERIVVPIRNYDGNLAGFTGRSIFQECGKCKKYHSPDKMCPVERSPKWLHSYDLNTGTVLFNIFESKDAIRKTGTAILTEGCLDVLRCVQNGIKNCLAVFGNIIKVGQIKLLVSAGVRDIILAMDNDSAGVSGAKISEKLLLQYFNVANATEMVRKDGDLEGMTKQEIENMLI